MRQKFHTALLDSNVQFQVKNLDHFTVFFRWKSCWELNQSKGPFKSRIRRWTITTDGRNSSSTGSRSLCSINKHSLNLSEITLKTSYIIKTHFWSGLKIAKPCLREMNPASASRNRTPSNLNWYFCSFSWFEGNIKHKRVFPEPGYTLFVS